MATFAVITRRGESHPIADDGGISPVEYLLQVMRDRTQPPEVRLKAASYAAPYCREEPLALTEAPASAECPACKARRIHDAERQRELRRRRRKGLLGYGRHLWPA